MKKQNKSIKELKEEYMEVYDAIYGVNACYGVRDLFWLNELGKELNERGIAIKMKPDFD